MRKVMICSIIMIPIGFLLFYVAWFTSILHTELGLVESRTGAFGLALMLMGIIFPLARLIQDRVNDN